MKLDEYLKSTGTGEEVFARRLRCSVHAVRKWRYGQRVPRPQIMAAIMAVTLGRVRADDFVPELKRIR